jgi:hypothetical protein
MKKEAPKVRKPAKIFVKLSGVYEDSAFVGSAYDARQDDMTKEDTVEYLAKPAIIQGLMNLLPQFDQQANRADANGLLKKKVRDQKAAVEAVIKQIAAM